LFTIHRIFLLTFVMTLTVLSACSKESDSDKPKIEHSIKIRFVDEQGSNLFNDWNSASDAIKIVYYDSDGNEHDFRSPDWWFASFGYTVNRQEYIFTIYFTLPEEGGDTITETYMRFFGAEPDVFTAEFDVNEGKHPDELYGGGTVWIKTVKLNGRQIWDIDNQPEEPVDIVKKLPL
ncbi:MAG: hypothetical protein LUG98_14550, partial [Tannerellaceae bacterium]|nr:hypothetical protein [Tannerellaceae bacterium]